MIWKHELNIDDQNTTKKFKSEILGIDPDIVVQVTKNKSQWLVKSSVERVGGGLDNRIKVTRALKNLYDKYGDKVAYHNSMNESLKNKPTLKTLVELVIKEVQSEDVLWSGSGWTIKKYKNRTGNISLSVENNNTGFIDYPIMYDHNGKIAYDYPERIPQAIKNKVQKIYPTLKESIIKETVWTVEKIKEELPPVKVKLRNGKIVQGNIYGRKLAFPVVSVNTDAGELTAEFSWTTLLRALESNSAVTI